MIASTMLRTVNASYGVHFFGPTQRRRTDRSRDLHTRYTGQVLRECRVRKGVGRPIKLRRATEDHSASLAVAARYYGSQRAAARALGMNLSTFQRHLKKEQAVGVPHA